MFSWRDGPFLQAMQNGDWVLLDELNLASQSVLEGMWVSKKEVDPFLKISYLQFVIHIPPH